MCQTNFFLNNLELCEDLTPVRHGIVYKMFKEMDEKDSPLTKRRRLENATTSPLQGKLTLVRVCHCRQ